MTEFQQVDLFLAAHFEVGRLRAALSECLKLPLGHIHVAGSVDELSSNALVNVLVYEVRGDFVSQLSIYGVSYGQIEGALTPLSEMLEVAIFLPGSTEQSLIGIYAAPHKIPTLMALVETETDGESIYRLLKS